MAKKAAAKPEKKSFWLEERIADVLLDGIDDKSLSIQQASTIAKYAIAQLKKINSEESTLAFLAELTKMYDKFLDLQTIVEGLFARKREKMIASQVLKLIQKGDANKAADLAKSSMEEAE